MSTTSATGESQIIRLRNTTESEQELWIEPLGDRVILSPNVLYELTATKALDEIDFSMEGFVVHGWVSKIAAVLDDGSENIVWELPE